MEHMDINRQLGRFVMITLIMVIIPPTLFWMFTFASDHYPKSRVRGMFSPSISLSEDCSFLNWGFYWQSDDAPSIVKDYYTEKWGVQFMPLGEIIPVASGIDYTLITPYEVKMPKSNWAVQKTIYVSTSGNLHRIVNNINHCKTPALQITYP